MSQNKQEFDMFTMTTLAGLGPRMMAAGLVVGVGLMVGCQADYAVDVTNRTPQPVQVSIFRKSGGDKAVLGASRRLGPGDRASLGPVRTSKDYGAFMSVDSGGNPGRPLTADLPKGSTFVEIMQDGEGPNSPLRIVEKR
jgi:hypothetical protein